MADTDSENEGILNNIQRLVIRPPGHTGKAKKGHICFDGGYETMNLGRVDFITNQEYDLFIRPDTANPRERYCPSVSRLKPPAAGLIVSKIDPDPPLTSIKSL